MKKDERNAIQTNCRPPLSRHWSYERRGKLMVINNPYFLILMIVPKDSKLGHDKIFWVRFYRFRRKAKLNPTLRAPGKYSWGKSLQLLFKQICLLKDLLESRISWLISSLFIMTRLSRDLTLPLRHLTLWLYRGASVVDNSKENSSNIHILRRLVGLSGILLLRKKETSW